MTELGRWMRYVAPASIGVAIYAVWLVLADKLARTDDLTDAALLAAATVPLGFAGAAAAGEFTWRRWLPARNINNAAILQDRVVYRSIRTLLSTRFVADSNPVQASARVSAAVYAAKGLPELVPGVERLERLLDLMNGLASGFVCSVAALAAVGVSAFWGPEFPTERESAAAVVAAAVGLSAMVACQQGQRRVSYVAEGYIKAMLPHAAAVMQRGRANPRK